MTKAAKKSRKKPSKSIPARFEPKFWTQADSRLAIVRQIRERYEILKAHAGADSVQRDILCQRATFLTVLLETAEREAIESGKLDAGSYTQSVNALLGLLRALGLQKSRQHVTNLKAYVAERESA